MFQEGANRNPKYISAVPTQDIIRQMVMKPAMDDMRKFKRKLVGTLRLIIG
jgi:hypothetical protein